MNENSVEKNKREDRSCPFVRDVERGPACFIKYLICTALKRLACTDADAAKAFGMKDRGAVEFNELALPFGRSILRAPPQWS
jgi:hypothetical protein